MESIVLTGHLAQQIVSKNDLFQFSLIETETSTSVHYNNSKKIPGIIVTDANENDQLIDDLLLLDTFKSKVGDFLHDGIKNGKRPTYNMNSQIRTVNFAHTVWKTNHRDLHMRL